LDIDPRYAKAWHDKGFALYFLKRYDEALQCAEEALRINSDDDLAYKLRQMILAELKR